MHTSGLSQGIVVTCRAHFEDELAEEVTWASHSHPQQMHFAADPQEDLHLLHENFLWNTNNLESALILPLIHPVMK